jgi:hypothetical protein
MYFWYFFYVFFFLKYDEKRRVKNELVQHPLLKDVMANA